MKIINLTFILYNYFLILWINATMVEGIIGGTKTEINLFKHQVSVFRNKQHICGGAIISQKEVLTNADCVMGEQFIQGKYSIKAGVNNILHNNPKEIKIKVDRIYVPSQNKPRNRGKQVEQTLGKLAILMLEKDLPFSENPNVAEIGLPEKLNNSYLTYANNRANVTGFGRGVSLSSSNPMYYGILKFAEATVLPTEDCVKELKRLFLVDVENHMCARVDQPSGRSAAGVCTGDSGAPLVYNKNTLIGVLSETSPNCNESEYPAIYTRVSNNMNFILGVKQGNPIAGTRIGICHADHTVEEIVV